MDELQSILKGTSVSSDNVVIDSVVKEGMLQSCVLCCHSLVVYEHISSQKCRLAAVLSNTYLASHVTDFNRSIFGSKDTVKNYWKVEIDYKLFY